MSVIKSTNILVNLLKEYLENKNKTDVENMVLNLPTLKEAHIYCLLNKLTSQSYGPLLEKYIRLKYNFVKNSPLVGKGDCKRQGQNAEIKVSFGGKTHSRFNFVQIRPSQNCSVYIFTAYYLSDENVDNEGELYIFKIPKEDMEWLIVDYGCYAHGTVKKHGKITLDSIRDYNLKREYALRVKIDGKCWNALLKYRVNESDI